MKTVAVARVCIGVCSNGSNGEPLGDWRLLKPEEVPEWLKNPDVLGIMLQGELARDGEDEASPWYCAVRLADPNIDGVAHPEAQADAGAPQIVLPGAPLRLVKPEESPVVGEMVEQGGVIIPQH